MWDYTVHRLSNGDVQVRYHYDGVECFQGRETYYTTPEAHKMARAVCDDLNSRLPEQAKEYA